MRKLVTVQEISEINPVDGADRIERATVLGWNVVVEKDKYSVGDKAVYFEVDTFLPETDERYASFQQRGQKNFVKDGVDIRGHVIRTIKLRGVVSQGLLMSLNDVGIPSDTPLGTDVTDLVNVVKFEEALPVSGDIIGRFDTRFCPKTDSIRVQSLANFWEDIKKIDWEPTVKVDGTSQTIVNDDRKIRVFSRNWEVDSSVAAMDVAEEHGLFEDLVPGMSIQFELIGLAIQKNKLKIPGRRPVVFAVWQDGVKLPRSKWTAAALRWAAPILGDEYKPAGTLEEMIEKVNGLRGCFTKGILDEGIVYHPVDPSNIPGELALELGASKNFKIISNKFLLKHKL